MYAEYRLGKGDAWKVHPGHKTYEEDYGDDEKHTSLLDIQAAGRNYTIFGLLSDVRGSGRMCQDKGLPDDLSPEVLAEWQRWEGDAHSPNNCSIEALKSVLAAAEVEYKKERLEELEFFKEMFGKGDITQEQYDRRIKMFDEDYRPQRKKRTFIDDIFYCHYSSSDKDKYPVPKGKSFYDLYSTAGYDDIAPALEQFIKDNTVQIPEANGLLDIEPEVRLIFWYDN